MRRMLLALSTVFALVALAAPVDAQINLGAQGAVLTSVDDFPDPAAPKLSGTFGLGARAVFQPPLAPFGLLAQGVYYFPDVDDSSYSTYSLAARLRLSTPMISPYAIGGWQWRRGSSGGESSTENGVMVGVGIQLHFAVALFVEATMEFNDEVDVTGVTDFDNNPIVIKAGIMFGG